MEVVGLVVVISSVTVVDETNVVGLVVVIQ